MPEYIYTDNNKHELHIIHGMNYDKVMLCPLCGDEMWRKPQAFAVNWGGLAPSAGGVSSYVQELNETRSERLDGYLEQKEKRNG